MEQCGMKHDLFWIIGAQRGGSTWLYTMLDAHPGITMAKPMRPEPKYFLDATLAEMGNTEYLERLFPNVLDGQVLGEKGTSYIEHPEAAIRIRSVYHNAKSLAILRNPVARAISNYHFSVQHGLENRTMREVFIENKPEPKISKAFSVSPFNYLGRGDYLGYLKEWKQVFGDDLRICVFEEITREISKLQEIYAWLGVEPSFVPSGFATRVNAKASSGNEDTEKEVADLLTSYYSTSIRAFEDWLGKKIPGWNDQIQ